MDCGPATLDCLLRGFGLEISYARLREACETGVDGTSIDTLEEVANELGLIAEQVLVPFEHLFIDEAAILPAILVVRSAGGVVHFVVVWRRLGNLLQVMDPAGGRRWVTAAQLREDVYLHNLELPADVWRQLRSSTGHEAALARRLAELGCTPEETSDLIGPLACDDWRPAATLDAAIRMAVAVARSGRPAERGSSAELVRVLHAEAMADDTLVPAPFWCARAAAAPERVIVSGVVALRVRGVRTGVATPRPSLAAVLDTPPPRPAAVLGELLAEGRRSKLGLLVAGLLLGALGTAGEPVLFRCLFELRDHLAGPRRFGALLLVLAGLGLLAGLDYAVACQLSRLGRRVEVRLRVAYLRALARLGDDYFRSRLISDMATRGHSLHLVRRLPVLAAEALRLAFEIAVPALGIVWLDARCWPLVVVVVVVGLAVPVATLPLLAERELRVRTFNGALVRYYLDALLAIVPIRCHEGELALRREQEGLVCDWSRAARRFERAGVGVDALLALMGLVAALGMLTIHVRRNGSFGSVLLLSYCALQLPAMAEQLAQLVRQYPAVRNTTLRILELVTAPGEDRPDVEPVDAETSLEPSGVAVALENVTVVAGGHEILRNVSLSIAPGEHVAIVGPSGAGKSALVGLLLGWHGAAAGRVLVDGEPLGGNRLEALRASSVWIDPAVHLWNEALPENLRFGLAAGQGADLSEVLEGADLHEVLERLPGGMGAPLGEGGAFVSGGEGQRVRVGRGMLRPRPRLVILDEAFRGLSRDQRHRLLEACRRRWAHATLLCATHDVEETQTFSRVLMIEGGELVEDGSPDALKVHTKYRSLLAAEHRVRDGLSSSHLWRRWRVGNGRIEESPASLTRTSAS